MHDKRGTHRRDVGLAHAPLGVAVDGRTGVALWGRAVALRAKVHVDGVETRARGGLPRGRERLARLVPGIVQGIDAAGIEAVDGVVSVSQKRTLQWYAGPRT